jgi:hypothetical protein
VNLSAEAAQRHRFGVVDQLGIGLLPLGGSIGRFVYECNMSARLRTNQVETLTRVDKQVEGAAIGQQGQEADTDSDLPKQSLNLVHDVLLGLLTHSIVKPGG